MSPHLHSRGTAGVTLLIGGARSGKSSLAVEIGRRHVGAVRVVATAEAFDDDMRTRIDRHRADRPPWPTTEEPLDLAGAVATQPADALVIIDCLTVWVGNLVHHGRSDDEIGDAARDALAAAAVRTGPTLVVSNEVGLGVHPETELGRHYRDVLGRVNQIWAAGADRTLWLVAGRAVPLLDPWEILE
jgi:adenosylcobinamide kinase / adenosylcobinamide-phosphate guanylyltransferase